MITAAGKDKARSYAATVRLAGVSVFYGEVLGLSRVDLELNPGVTGIVGPNGSGKSTLMKTLTGLMPPDEGTLRILDGNPFRDAWIRQRIGFVPALECFHSELTGRRNLTAAFLSHGHGGAEAKSLAIRALEISGLTADGDRRYSTWSRGMRQRLKLGLVLAEDRPIVLLDEPFLGVDPPTRRQLRQQILDLGEAGRTVLVSSHVLHEVEALTDRVGVLAHGRLLGFGRIADLLESLRDRHPHRVRLLLADPRKLAAALAALPHITEIKLGSEGELEFVTDRPEIAYRELPGIIAETGCLVRRVETLDNGLAAVFRHVTAPGGDHL